MLNKSSRYSYVSELDKENLDNSSANNLLFISTNILLFFDSSLKDLYLDLNIRKFSSLSNDFWKSLISSIKLDIILEIL